MTTHPRDFYIVHHLFSGVAFPRGPVWGTLTDGPADRDEAWRVFVDGVECPTRENVYVLHVQEDVPARDVTEDWVLRYAANFAEDDDEPDHERQERHSWEQV
jgi:hypothetical protein